MSREYQRGGARWGLFVRRDFVALCLKALAVPDLQKRFFDNGVAAAPVTPAEFTRFVNAETEKWKKVVTISGAKIEQ